MNFRTGLWQQQTLKLTMTQELSQAIALLQYSSQELTNFLESKALENPLITLRETSSGRLYKKGHANPDKSDWIERIADKSFSIEDQLFSQLNIRKYSGIQLCILKTIIQYLDENGYFRGDIGEISKQKNVPKTTVEECLAVIQGLDPAGIGARNLQECLLIQLKRRSPADQLAIQMISDYFALFAERKWVQLANELGITTSKIQNIFDSIQELNPKPGMCFAADQTHFIVPDALFKVTESGISIHLYEAAAPNITFNSTYYQQFSKSQDQLVKKFLQEKLQDFQLINKGLEKRRDILIKVIMKIAEKQPEYFLKGPNHLNPLTMNELAQELGVHESTISRAVREKYVQTPSGTVPLKSFFSSSIQTISHKNASATQVKNVISLMISKENKKNPLSDQEIAELLKTKESIVISRRTVAKYRDQLGIPSSTIRKRY